MLLREFWTGYKRGEGVKFGGGRECLCYQWENLQPLLWLMNEFSEWMRSHSALMVTFRRTGRDFMRILLEELSLWDKVAQTKHRFECTYVHTFMCIYLWSVNIHDLLLACAHLCIVSCNPAIHLSPPQNTSAWPAPKQNRQITSLWFSLVVIVCTPWFPNCLFSFSFNSPGLLLVIYSLVSHIHSAQEPCSDVPRCLL